MNEIEILNKIQEIIGGIAASKEAPVPQITPETLLLGGGLPIESLDLATLVVELDEATGIDPFKKGFVNFRTAGELAKLYRQ
jgi:acyl carrier protein